MWSSQASQPGLHLRKVCAVLQHGQQQGVALRGLLAERVDQRLQSHQHLHSHTRQLKDLASQPMLPGTSKLSLTTTAASQSL